MMFKRVLTRGAVLMASAASLSLPALAQNYPPPPGYSQPIQPYEERGRPVPPSAGTPDFDILDDDDDAPKGQGSASLSPPGPSAGYPPGPPQPGYQSAPPPQAGNQQAVPQGPILSPDDPRYGRPPGPPPVIYSDRNPGPNPVPNPAYDDRNSRPPGTVDGRTGSAAPAPVGADGRPVVLSALPADEQPETGPRKELPPNLRRQEVSYPTKEPAGTIIVDTSNTQLYYILGGGRAIRYGVRVGRDGFTWTGVQKITRKMEWPDWHPPPEMIERQPYLPRFMAGGDGNPLGARAMYLGATVYRIHGTNQPSTIGQFVSSGCIGMLNEDVTDLFDRVKVGTRVVVLPGGKPPEGLTASAQSPGAGPVPAPMASGQAAVNLPGTGPTVVPPLPAPVTIR
jgi:lipoprotein-anchoring transpeptidase ErfK/SrfK